MKLAIIGSRSLPNNIDIFTIENIVKDLEITKIISGGARGADSLGASYADYKGLGITVYKPDWSLGRHAGFLRNTKIVEDADIILALWDMKSKGTEDSIKKAIKLNKKILVFDINELKLHEIVYRDYGAELRPVK